MPKDCPMCGETMRLDKRERIVQIPGTPQTIRRQSPEWVCPECEHFEELSDEDAEQ